MDYRIFHAVDEFSFDYKWLAHATYAFETFGVVVYAAAVLFLWLLTPPGSERRWKIAALCGGVSALISLGINQLIGDFIWHRPGRIFLVVATLIAAGRVVVGAHYLTDVLASLVISAIVAYLVARFGRPLLLRLAILLERLTDPLVAPFQRRWRARFDSAS